MFRVFAVILALSSAHATAATECEGLGLKSGYLTEHFCNQLQDLVPPGKTRGTGGSSDTATGQPALPDWADIELLQEAYRADPRKTLELIKRIKSAGGLPES